MDKKLYSTSEAARILRISRMGVFNRIKKGKLKAEKIGRNYVIGHEALTEALGRSIGKDKKERIDKAVHRAMKYYGETFKKLAKE